MEHDSSLGTEWRLRNRSVSEDPSETELRHGRPAPSVRRDRSDSRRVRRSETFLAEADVTSLAASLPLFLIGAGCTGFGIFVRLENSHAVIDRIPLWLPLVAIGVIALLGGTLSFFATPEDSEETTEVEQSARRSTRPTRRPERPLPEARSASGAARAEAPAATLQPPISPLPSAEGPRRFSPPPTHPGTLAAPSALDPARSEDDPENLASLLEVLDSIDGDLGTPPAPSADVADAPTSRAAVDADAAAIDAELADLLGETQPRVARVRPPAARLPPGARPVPVHCVECGSPIEGPAAAGRCYGCQEPLCAACRARSVEEGKPDLCVFCSVLDEFPPKGTASPASGPS